MAIATIKPPSDFAELVRTHQAGIWRYLRFLGADETQADDLTQETFLCLYRRPFVEVETDEKTSNRSSISAPRA